MIQFWLILVLLPTLCFATKAGGGGIGIACYKGDEIISVELLDLYELRVRNLTLIKDLSGDVKKDSSKLAGKIFKDAREVNKVLKIMAHYHSIPSDSELTLTNDAFPISIPRGCQLKQVANYYNDSTIWIDKILFDKMNYVNQLALAFHEHIYALERTLEVPDSRYSRTIVGWAFSDQDPFELVSFNTGYSHLCKSPDSKIAFHASKVSKKGNVWKFSFITLNGHRMFTSKYGHFAIAEVSPLGDYRQDYPYGSAELKDYSSVLTSKINEGEWMAVSSNSESLSLSWVGTDPRDKFEDVKVSCFKKSL